MRDVTKPGTTHNTQQLLYRVICKYRYIVLRRYVAIELTVVVS